MADDVRRISRTDEYKMMLAEATSSYRGHGDEARLHCIQKQLGLGVVYEPRVRVLEPETGETRLTNSGPMTVAERIDEEIANDGEHARLLRYR